MDDTRARCAWATGSPIEQAYHDEVWGVPLFGERPLFELLTLEGAQAGLSWSTILRRWDGYRKAFDDFDPELVARFDDTDRERLMQDTGIIRNRAKIAATIGNAQAILRMRNEGIDFGEYLWTFVGGKPRTNRFRSLSELPAQTPESKAMSKTLKERDFAFVGPTICYALMQAAGMVNDHVVECYRWAELAEE